MKRYEKQVNVWLSSELIEFIKNVSSLMDRSYSDIIRQMLSFGMDKMKIEN